MGINNQSFLQYKITKNITIMKKLLLLMLLVMTMPMTMMADAVQEALTMWEPRIFVRNVLVERDPKVETALVCKIEYEINTTHDNRNIVHPFYIDKEPELD